MVHPYSDSSNSQSAMKRHWRRVSQKGTGEGRPRLPGRKICSIQCDARAAMFLGRKTLKTTIGAAPHLVGHPAASCDSEEELL